MPKTTYKRVEGWESMKKAHDQQLAFMDQMSRENPKAVLSWIEGELLSGKFLILPSAIYKQCVDLCRENGISEEAIKNLHESVFLPALPKALKKK